MKLSHLLYTILTNIIGMLTIFIMQQRKICYASEDCNVAVPTLTSETCVVSLDDSMFCQWRLNTTGSPDCSQRLQVVQDLFLRWESSSTQQNPFNKLERCSGVRNLTSGCTWNTDSQFNQSYMFSFFRTYYMFVNITDLHSGISYQTNTLKVDPFQLVKASDFSLTEEVGSTTFTLQVQHTWYHSSNHVTFCETYNCRFYVLTMITTPGKLLCSKNVTSHFNFNSQLILKFDTKNLDCIMPNTNFSIRAVAKYMCPQTGESLFWSNPFEMSLKTLPDVPGAVPQVTANNYQVVYMDQSVAVVRFYWQMIALAKIHADTWYTRLRWYAVYPTIEQLQSCDCLPDHCTSATKRNNSYEVSLQRDTDYYMFIDITNSIGCNGSLYSQVKSVNVDHTYVTHHDVIHFGVEANMSAVFVKWLPVEGARSYTLFWCHNNNNYVTDHCEDRSAIQWTRIAGESTNVTINMDRPLLKQFALAAEIATNSSAAKFTPMYFANCVNSQLGSLAVPTLVLFSFDEGHIQVKWTTPPCDSRLVNNYIINYCRAPCSEGLMTEVYVGALSKRAVYQQDLTTSIGPGHTYQVWLTALSPFDNVEPVTSQMYNITITAKKSGFTKGILAGVACACVFLFILTALGIYLLSRKICKKGKKYLAGPDICLPPKLPNREDDHSSHIISENYQQLTSLLVNQTEI